MALGEGGLRRIQTRLPGGPKSVLGESTWELGSSTLVTEGLRWVFRSLV